MYWLNLDSVPLHPSSLFAAIPNFHESPDTRKFPGLVVHKAENVNDPWFWELYWVRDDGSSSNISNINSFPRVNLKAGVPGATANYHRNYVRPATSIDANGVTYTRKLSFGSTSGYTGGYGVIFTCDDTIAKNGIEPGATGNQTDFRTTFGYQAITLGEPTFIDRIRHHLCDLYRPCHFFTTEGEVMDFSGSPFAQYHGNWVNLPNLNAYRWSWGNPSLNDTARLGKTVDIGDYDNVLNGVTPSSTVFPGVVEYDPPTVVWNSQTIATSSLIQKGVGVIQNAVSSTSTIGGTPYYFLTITTDTSKFWAENELVGKQFVINQFTRFGHLVNFGGSWQVRSGVSSNTVSTIVLSALDPIQVPAAGSNFYSDDRDNYFISHQSFGASLDGASIFHSRFPPKWRYYNDQHASNMLITCYVALTGDYMVEEDFEHMANMELALYRPWMGIPPDVKTGLISNEGYGQFPGGGEREYGRRLLFFTNPMCVTKPSVVSKFHELCKIMTDKVDAWFRSQTNNYTDYDKTCLQLGYDGAANDRNPVYSPTEDGVAPITPVGIWAPWQMSYIIRGLYSFTKFNNDSKYRDLLLRFIRTLFLYGIFKEPEGQMPANRPGPGTTIAPLANRLWPNTWKLIANIRINGDLRPLPASSYYECDKLRLPTDGMSPTTSEGFWSRLRVEYSPPGFGESRGCYKGASPFDVSCALSGSTVVSGISTEPLRSILTDFNREMFIDNGYINWTFPAAQIAASIVRDSDEAGARYPFFSGVIQARENARDYLNSIFFRSSNLNHSNNEKYGRRVTKYSPSNFLEYWCYAPIPLTQVNQYPFNSIQSKEMTSSGTAFQFGVGGETGNYSMQPTPTNGGWTVFTSSVDSRIIYVSDSSGNDANNGLSPATPKKSLGAGYALLRNGYPDWLLMARGDTFHYTGTGTSALGLTGGTNWNKSGRSNDERMIWGAYGDESLPRPIIKMFNKQPIRSQFGIPEYFGTDQSFTRNLNFVSLEFVSEFYPNFSGQGDADYAALDFTYGIRNFLMEDCSIHDTSEGIILQSFGQGANQLSLVDTILDLRDPNSLAASTFSKNVKIYRCSFYNLQVSGSNRPTQTNNPRLQSIFATAVFDLIIEECTFDELFYSERIPNILANIYSHHLYLADFCIAPVVAKNIFSRSSAQGAKMTLGGFCARNLFMRNLIAAHAGGCGNVSYGNNETITNPVHNIESPIGENSENGVCFEWVNRQKATFYANVSMDNRDLVFPSGVQQYGNEPTRFPGQLRQSYGWHYSTHGSREVVVYDNIAIGTNTSSAPYKVTGGVGLAIGGGEDDFFPRFCHVVNNIFYNISGTAADSRVFALSHLGAIEPIPGMRHSDLFSMIGNIVGFSSTPSPTGNVRAIAMADGWINPLSAMNFGGNIFQSNNLQAVYTNNAPTSVTQWWSRVRDFGSVIQTPTFPDPTRDLEKYQLTVENPTGGLNNYDFFMKKARENRKGAWDPRYTAAPVIDYIREGFGKPKFF